MEFRDKYSDTSGFISESGSKYLDQYEYQFDKDGVNHLVKTDKPKNVFEAIQADYDSTDINKLMLRFSLGDLSAIDVTQGFYADVTKMPKTMAELFDKAQDCYEFFNQLPVDFKQMFNNSYTEFFSELNKDSKSVMAKVDEYNDRFVNHQFESFEDESEVNEKGEE